MLAPREKEATNIGVSRLNRLEREVVGILRGNRWSHGLRLRGLIARLRRLLIAALRLRITTLRLRGLRITTLSRLAITTLRLLVGRLLVSALRLRIATLRLSRL